MQMKNTFKEIIFLFIFIFNLLVILGFTTSSETINCGEEIIISGDIMDKSVEGENPISPSEKFETKEYSLLASYEYDINEDKIQETIALYTSAKKDSNGEILWDDGQKWVLVVQEEDKDYELYNNYLQLGTINFAVFTAEDGFHITIVEDAVISPTVVDYIFNKEESSFIPSIYSDSLKNVNTLYISKRY